MSKKTKISLLIVSALICVICVALFVLWLIGDLEADSDDSATTYVFKTEAEANEFDAGEGFAVFSIGKESSYNGTLLCNEGIPVKYSSQANAEASYAFYFIHFGKSLDEFNKDLSYAETLNLSGIPVKIITRSYDSGDDVKIYFEAYGNTYQIILYSDKGIIDYMSSLEDLIGTLTGEI